MACNGAVACDGVGGKQWGGVAHKGAGGKGGGGRKRWGRRPVNVGRGRMGQGRMGEGEGAARRGWLSAMGHVTCDGLVVVPRLGCLTI